jgi:hypothetical protein
MAIARLINPKPVPGGTAWTVDVELGHAFAGPPDRDWDSFRAEDAEAEYRWRTGADKVRQCAERVAAGECSVESALGEEAVEEWLDANWSELVELLEEDSSAEAQHDDEELKGRILVELGPRVSDIGDGPLSYYLEDSDFYLRDAAWTLDLPPWARVWLHDAGGMGSGYTAAEIVIAEGKELQDLAAWLAERK